MEITEYSCDHKIIYSRSVFLVEPNSELRIDVKANESFSFEIVLNFLTDDTNKRNVEKTVIDKTMIFKCYNFNHSLGTGTTRPISIATIAGKEWLLHFWTYLMGDTNSTRKVEYTLFEKNG